MRMGTDVQLRGGKISYLKKAGVLVRKFEGAQGICTQVCVPNEFRLSVLSLGHTLSLSRHLGTARTKGRIICLLFLSREYREDKWLAFTVFCCGVMLGGCIHFVFLK